MGEIYDVAGLVDIDIGVEVPGEPEDLDTDELVRGEVEETDPGVITADDETWVVYQAVRRRQRAVAELGRLKKQMALLVREQVRLIEGIDRVYGPRLRAWAAEHLTAGKKSVKTPWGTLGFRTVPARLALADEERVIREVEHGCLPVEVRRVKITVNWEVLKRHHELTGKVPAGCAIVPAEEKFYVR